MKYAVIDIESTGLNRYKDSINYIGIGLAKELGEPLTKKIILNMYEDKDLDRFKAIIQKLKDQKIKTVLQNGKFDTLYIELKYGITIPIHYDIMLLGTAYDLAAPHALDDMALNWLNIPSWDIPLREKTKPNNPKVENEYLPKDLEVPWDLLNFFFENLTAQQWRHYNELLKPAYLMYRRAEKYGIWVDQVKLKAIQKLYKQEEEKKLAELKKIYDINWRSSDQIQKVLYEKEKLPTLKRSKETGKPSADAKVLKKLIARGAESSIPKMLLDYKFYYGANSKFLNRWGKDSAYDGRIHPSFNLTNVVTGRTSCSDPNLQQVPRLKELRTLFSAPPGRVLIEADYSQLELRIAADYSKDPTMIKIYREGGDIHTETAKSLAGKETPTKEDRTKAKPVNFGFVYGMMAKGFVDYAFDNYGAVFSMAEAQRYRDLFFLKYSRLLPWHDEMAQLCEALGGVENRFGRFRSLPDIYSQDKWEKGNAIRRAINTPVQSTGSDLLLFSASQIDKELREELDLHIVGTIHDSILADVPEKYAEPASKEIKRIMEHPDALDNFGVSFKVPLVADIGIGAWGSK